MGLDLKTIATSGMIALGASPTNASVNAGAVNVGAEVTRVSDIQHGLLGRSFDEEIRNYIRNPEGINIVSTELLGHFKKGGVLFNIHDQEKISDIVFETGVTQEDIERARSKGVDILYISYAEIKDGKLKGIDGRKVLVNVGDGFEELKYETSLGFYVIEIKIPDEEVKN